jgi:hypothetical protein
VALLEAAESKKAAQKHVTLAMPTCKICGTAYLDGERHVCAPKSSALRVLGMGVAGLVGGLTGFYVLTFIFCFW